MALRGLVPGWSFAFHRAVRRSGACWFQEKKISLSLRHVEHHDALAVEDTILHEIAHAICGPSSAHHDAVWRETALRLGADPGRREVTPPGRWQANCPACGHLYSRHRDPAKSPVVARGQSF
jgi:predicted SprT family Zn-dependent metalloprotease